MYNINIYFSLSPESASVFLSANKLYPLQQRRQRVCHFPLYTVAANEERVFKRIKRIYNIIYKIQYVYTHKTIFSCTHGRMFTLYLYIGKTFSPTTQQLLILKRAF